MTKDMEMHDYDMKTSAGEHVDIDKEVMGIMGEEHVEVDPETSRKLFWMLNRRILPLMLGVYFCQSLDKSAVGFASIMGIIKDAHLVGNQYNWLGTILYLGTVAGEVPVNYLIQKLPIAKLVAVNIFLWGAVTACTAAINDFAGLAATRFLLGLFEACIFPSFLTLTSMWYTRQEQLLILSFWGCMPGVQIMVGGLLAYGVEHYTHGVMKSWQLLFMVLGIATVALAILIGLLLPDSPTKAKCYSDDVKKLLVARVRANQTGVQPNKAIKWYQVREAIRDPLIWCCFGMQTITCMFVGGLAFFSNLIVASFGYNYLQTQLLNLAQGAIVVLILIGSFYAAKRTGQTLYTLMAIGWIPIVGMVLVMKITPNQSNKVGLLIAYYMTLFTWPCGEMVNSIISRNIAGSSKRTACLIINFIAWSGGNAAAPQFYKRSEAPRYTKAFIVNLCLFSFYYVLLFVTRFILARRNRIKRQNAVYDENGKEVISQENAFADLTDFENPDFRYCM
ncbi:major facilitator superfamily domain-containing protein [Lipomyces doorenjongii]|uniref:major facilitator superfamily domain-containing protein n=1 Tax=Lipomyces doorenjongii TaxID=383834 RepID=UPI0034CF9D5E